MSHPEESHGRRDSESHCFEELSSRLVPGSKRYVPQRGRVAQAEARYQESCTHERILYGNHCMEAAGRVDESRIPPR